MSDDEADDCPLCRGEIDAELVERILSARVIEPPMTLNEFRQWLRSEYGGDLGREEAIEQRAG